MVSNTNVCEEFVLFVKHNKSTLKPPSTSVFRKRNLSTISMSRSDYLFTPTWPLFLLYISFPKQKKPPSFKKIVAFAART